MNARRMAAVGALAAGSLFLSATVLYAASAAETAAAEKATIQMPGRLVYEVWTPAPWSHRNDGHWPQWWLVFDRLLENNGQHIPEIPSLATSWDISEDGLQYTFHLRDDVVFHDGTPFTAHDVKATFEIILDGYVTSPTWIGNLLNLDGVDAHRSGGADGVSGIEAVDDYTVRFHLTRRTPGFLRNVSITSIMSKAQAELVGEGSKVEGHPTWSVPNGTGPFKVVETEPFQFIRLEKHDAYHRGTPKIDEIIIHAKDPALAAANHEADFAFFQITPTSAKEVAKLEHMEVFAQVLNHLTAMSVNINRPELRDPRVRRALMMAIDRQTIADSLYGDYGDPIVPQGILPAIGWRNPNLTPVNYDPDGAKALLAEAGWDFGTTVTILLRDIDAGGIRLELATIVQDYWKEIGIAAEVELVEVAVIGTRLNESDFDFYMGGWSAVTPEALLRLRSDSPAPIGRGYSNPEVDRIAEQITTTYDMDELRALYDELQVHAWNDMVYMPVINTMGLKARSSRLSTPGVIPDILNFPIDISWHEWEVVE